MYVYEKKPLSRVSRFRFHWTSGSLNDNGTAILKKHCENFCYYNMKLYVIKNEKLFPIEYERVRGDLWEMKIFHP